ncbi:AB hydrolase superfamily protein B1A11.02 [Paramyrothecium foliicola]|nr:AB hydrolase superfamily protein B1A11.02 [Paramyrothecium foliicola]
MAPSLELADTRTSASSKKATWANGMDKAPKNVAWYQATLSRVPGTAHEILRNYSGVREDEILDHVSNIRDKAWDIFLDFPAYLQPVYPEVLDRIKSGGETFLDLGCCFGQDIRKLIHDGAPSQNLIGVDTEPRFLELGYELFRDRQKIRSRFLTGDVFDDDFLAEYRGKIDIIFLGSFLHLFTFEQQVTIVGQLVKLLRDVKGSLVFGRHMAAENGGVMKENACGWSLYHHSDETMQRLWDTAPHGRWDVSSQMVPYKSEAWDNGVKWQGEGKGASEVQQQLFTATRQYSEVSPQWAKFVAEAPKLRDLDKVGIVERKKIFIELETKVPARALPHDATDKNVSVRTFTIRARDGHDLPVRSYVPNDQTAATIRPVLVYLHAGGFLFGDLESGDLNCRVLAARLGISILNVGYRLAPEWPFPCGVNDAYDATEWVSSTFVPVVYNYALTTKIEVAVNAKQFLDASPEHGFLVGGISSGANFAGVIAYTARDAGLTPPITGLFLSIPVCLMPQAYHLVPPEWLNQLLSLEQNAENPLLTRKSLTDIQGRP